ncbi:hypothetical protein [Desulfatiglans anilini]|uniref:hypothetical protein n=1 Tax=Desulfatiglans anilini TaxID=90728 RepID=UPI000409A5BD|nr:hypothetical protein [Desulfatiglans anilini]
MNVLEQAKKTEFLGREFLLWLWFRSETEGGVIDIPDLGAVEFAIEGKVVLQSEGDEGVETVTCSGERPALREARYALTRQKQVVQAMIKLAAGDERWSFLLDSCWFNVKGYKGPKVLMDRNDDPDGLFFEKVLLLERCAMALDALFEHFVLLRISPEWEAEERPAISAWIEAGA